MADPGLGNIIPRSLIPSLLAGIPPQSPGFAIPILEEELIYFALALNAKGLPVVQRS